MSNRVLVVNEELYMRRLVEMILERNGYEPLLASSAAEGLHMLCELPVAAVTCDLGMPGMSGQDFIGRIQADPRLENIPVILITAAGTEEDLQRARQKGAAGALVKPFSERQLLDLLRQAVSPPDPPA